MSFSFQLLFKGGHLEVFRIRQIKIETIIYGLSRPKFTVFFYFFLFLN